MDPTLSRKGASPNDMGLPYHTILFQADFDHPSEVKGLLSESWNASKTVCGQVWLDNSLPQGQKENILFDNSSSVNRFGMVKP